MPLEGIAFSKTPHAEVRPGLEPGGASKHPIRIECACCNRPFEARLRRAPCISRICQSGDAFVRRFHAPGGHLRVK